MLKWILILLVPGVILLSSLDNGNSAKNSPAPVQVQNIAPQTQSVGEKTTVQTEKQAGTAQITRPAATKTVEVAPKPTVTCSGDYYVNVNGNCVHRPSDNPSGASAQCRDGSYSYSQNRRGTCSGHGGVSSWY